MPRIRRGPAGTFGYPRRRMVPISEKISKLLEQRGLMKRDLARALGVSPQTATDICKGRSAVTIQHLRKLVEFFGLRADFWLDESRATPTISDNLFGDLSDKVHHLARTGLFYAEDPSGLYERLRQFAMENQETFRERFGEPTGEERRILGMPDTGMGIVGRIGG